MWQYNDEVINSKGKIEFLFESPENRNDDLSFKIDDLRFNQITDNLLLNAFRFTESGSITMGYYYENDNVHIYIRDTGVGISEEYQKSIFERFRQVDELRVRPFSGTGLGLAITKKLVEHLSGKIRIESQPGKGSTFFITFPLAGGKSVFKPKVETAAKKVISKTFLAGKKILIVEDNDSSFEFLEVVLQRRGAQIIRATNGLEAFDLATKNDYDVILMDLQLPEMNGFEAIEQIRISNTSTPIIVQTAFSESSERTKAFDAGCDAYLVKPITKNKLEEAISKFC
jgi:CheY-like chemotaxis protein